MFCKLINISSPVVFKKYSKIYNIFRDLYEVSSFGLELSGLSLYNANEINKMLLANGYICYKNNIDDNSAILFTIAPFNNLKEMAGLIRSGINEEIGHSIDLALKNHELYDTKSISIAGTQFTLDQVYIAGILNVTPDSFSDGGKFVNAHTALKHALNMLDAGADIIDIGGESTRPGSQPVSTDEELKRVIPVIEQLKTVKPDVIISIDTTKSVVAKEALKAGASIVNDISSMTFDDRMAEVIAEYNSAVILMHIKGTPESMQDNPYYSDVVDEVYKYLISRIKYAKMKGISDIIIDPGFGFGKRLTDNYELLNRMNEFKSLGYPIMAGVSRKSMLGAALGLDVNDRETATIITESVAVNNGARFIRTHNVKNALQLKQLYSFINKPEMLANV